MFHLSSSPVWVYYSVMIIEIHILCQFEYFPPSTISTHFILRHSTIEHDVFRCVIPFETKALRLARSRGKSSILANQKQISRMNSLRATLFSFRSLSLSLILCITILWFRRVISTCIRKFLYFPCHSSARDFSPPFHVNESQTHYPRTVVLITLLCNFQQQKVVMEWTPSFSFTFCFFFCLLYSDFNFHVDKKKFFFCSRFNGWKNGTPHCM